MESSFVNHNEIVIFSKDRTGGTSSSDFSINLKQNILNAKVVELVGLNMLNTFYNITTANNVISYSDGGGAHTFTIPVGGYIIDDLITVIGTGMTTNSGTLTYTVVYNANSLLVTISATGNFSLLFSSANNPAVLLGFASSNLTGVAAYTAPNIFNIMPFINCYINISEFTPTNVRSAGIPIVNYSFNVPINVNFGTLIQLSSSLQKQKICINSTGNISTLTVCLYSDDGNKFSLGGSEWSMKLRLYY